VRRDGKKVLRVVFMSLNWKATNVLKDCEPGWRGSISAERSERKLQDFKVIEAKCKAVWVRSIFGRRGRDAGLIVVLTQQNTPARSMGVVAGSSFMEQGLSGD